MGNLQGKTLKSSAIEPPVEKRAGWFDPCEHQLEPKSHACAKCAVPLSKVSGLPMRPVPECPAGEGHFWIPELHYGTSFGLVLFCGKCGWIAQCEIERPPGSTEAKPWYRPRMMERRLLKAEARWGYCKKWKAGDLPHESNHHLWPIRIEVGEVSCQRCERLAVVARIYTHPGGDGGKTDPQVWASRFKKVLP